MKYFLSALLSFVVLSSFSQQLYTAGRVIDTVQTSVPDQTYALYLPESYTSNKKYPVIFFFEPLARGRLPVDRYQSLAEKYDLILTCSNNSRNYTSPFLSFDAADFMINDVLKKFSVNEDLIIASGFSGGSRVAIAVSTLTDHIKGVIGIGAVGPIYSEHGLKKYHKIPYAGLVGNKDFNYVEHFRGEQQFQKEGIENIRLVFDRDHKWAPADDYEIALIWMLAQLDVKQRERVLDMTTLQEYLTYVGDSVSIIDAKRVHGYFSSHFGLEMDVSKFDISDFAKEEKRFIKTIELEERLRKQYMDSLTNAYRSPANKNTNTSMNWIIDTGRSYKRRAKQVERKNPQRAEMYQRLSNFISASSYENSVDAMIKKIFDRAFIGIEIWSGMVENEGWEYWMKCKLHAINNDIPTATRYLDKLIKIGFENGQALKADTTFSVLSATEQYRLLTADN